MISLGIGEERMLNATFATGWGWDSCSLSPHPPLPGAPPYAGSSLPGESELFVNNK